MKNPCTYIKKEYSGCNKQSGFSLVELLVAMVIGLFLLIGITTSYLSSKRSSINRDQISILEDNGRIALEVLTNTLQHTGYMSTDLALVGNPFLATRPVDVSCGTGVSSVLDNTNFPLNGTEDNDDGDTLSVFYLGDNELFTDCSGGVLPPVCRVGGGAASEAHRIYNAFYIDGDNNLQCAGSRRDDLETIAEGVENFQILYGMDTDDDKYNKVDRYVNATDVGANWGQVVSIQVAILVRTLNQIKTQSEQQSFTLLDKKVDAPNDRFHRAVFSTTINLRNL